VRGFSVTSELFSVTSALFSVTLALFSDEKVFRENKEVPLIRRIIPQLLL
jgi:hypothetical protein